MSRIAFVFPGQGAQELGMGRDLFGKDPLTDELAEIASSETGVDIAALCRRGPARDLARTEYLQPAMCVVCVALWNKLHSAGLRPDMVAGHSLGELPALAAAGVLSAQQVVSLAVERGRLMAEAAAERKGAMAAVLGWDVERLAEHVANWPHGVLDLGAVNAREAATISGDAEAVEQFCQEAQADQLGVRFKPLAVSGAWHSHHMEPAVAAFREALGGLCAREATCEMVVNRDGEASGQRRVLLDAVSGQLMSPVRWDKVMATFWKRDVSTIIEVGPGKVLRGLARSNAVPDGVNMHGVADGRQASRIVRKLGQTTAIRS